MYQNKIEEESCSPLKDMTSLHSPTEGVSNMEMTYDRINGDYKK